MDFTELKGTLVDSVIGTSQLICQFNLKKFQIDVAKRLWKQSVLSEDFLVIFSAKPLCGSECPPHLAKPLYCSFKSDSDLSINVLTPVINPDYVVVEAFPFEMMIKNASVTCRKVYKGTKKLVMSRKGKCIVRSSFNDENGDSYGFIKLQTDYKCLRDSEPQFFSKYWNVKIQHWTTLKRLCK